MVETEFQPFYYTASNGCKMPYRKLLPATYVENTLHPVILFLHGGGERGDDNAIQLKHGASLFIRPENRASFPSIVLFPQCPKDGYWASADVDRSVMPRIVKFDYSKKPTIWLEAALEILDQTIRSENADTTRIYIVGLSMGGMGTFEAVHLRPYQFAAAIAICGGGDTLRYSDQINGFPFRVFHGTDDDVIEVKHSREMVAKLKRTGANVTYIEYPGVKHNSWDNAFHEEDFLPWLFAQKKN